MENCIVANVLKFDTRTVNFCKLFTFLPKLFADNNISKSLKFEKSFSFSSCQIDLYIHLNNLMEISISVQNETLSLTIRVQREAIYVYPPSLHWERERSGRVPFRLEYSVLIPRRHPIAMAGEGRWPARRLLAIEHRCAMLTHYPTPTRSQWELIPCQMNECISTHVTIILAFYNYSNLIF